MSHIFFISQAEDYHLWLQDIFTNSAYFIGAYILVFDMGDHLFCDDLLCVLQYAIIRLNDGLSLNSAHRKLLK